MRPRRLAIVRTLPAPSRHLKAVQALGAHNLFEARAIARRELEDESACSCCRSPRDHLARFVGSTLYFDDDPAHLRRAIPFEERLQWTPRILAACIVLYGRERIDLYPHTV
jgi:hypothetical protein